MTDEQIDEIISEGGYRNAAGGIYATSTYQFARDCIRAAAPPASYKTMFEEAVSVLAEIDRLLDLPEDGCNSPQQTLSALRKRLAKPAAPNVDTASDDDTRAAFVKWCDEKLADPSDSELFQAFSGGLRTMRGSTPKSASSQT